jgi:hypothetical protein
VAIAVRISNISPPWCRVSKVFRIDISIYPSVAHWLCVVYGTPVTHRDMAKAKYGPRHRQNPTVTDAHRKRRSQSETTTDKLLLLLLLLLRLRGTHMSMKQKAKDKKG